jgi:hypothetical protein
METGYRSAIVVSIALEVATIALLGAHLMLRRDAVTPVPLTVPSQPPRIS